MAHHLPLLQVIKLDHDFGTAVSGVLTDSQARVLALWGSYSEQAGIPSHTCTPADCLLVLSRLHLASP